MDNRDKKPYEDDIAISSRLRLARNINNLPFPNRMTPDQAKEVVMMVTEALNSINGALVSDLLFVNMKELTSIDRQVLVEKHLISPDMGENRKDSAAIISRDERISIMINEEDHLRLQCIFPGMRLKEAYKLCNELDILLEEKLEFAFDKSLGYLTCCPTNIGTGIRASLMLHLPALGMTGYIKSILETCSKLGIAVRGIYGENSEAAGNMFQISNQVSIGQTEEEIVASVLNIAGQIVEQERLLRNELYTQNPYRFEDRVFRSLGLLTNARILTSEESLKLLSDVRLGVDMNTIPGIEIDTLNDIMLFIQPAYLQKMSGKLLSPEERDVRRADIVRSKLKL